jgi:hypothetical protein
MSERELGHVEAPAAGNRSPASASRFGLVSIAPHRSGMLSQVAISSAYLKRITRSFLRLVHVSPSAYAGFQTARVLTPR